jgi:hypothetical protein
VLIVSLLLPVPVTWWRSGSLLGSILTPFRVHVYVMIGLMSAGTDVESAEQLRYKTVTSSSRSPGGLWDITTLLGCSVEKYDKL